MRATRGGGWAPLGHGAREAAEMRVPGQASAYLLSDLGKLFKLGVHLSEMGPHEHLFPRGAVITMTPGGRCAICTMGHLLGFG